MPESGCHTDEFLDDGLQISLRVHDSVRTPTVPRDYNLRRQNMRANASFVVPNTYIFSEKDLPGHVDKANILFNESQTHGRSYLYEQMKKDSKKKTKSKKWEPYIRKTIPSKSMSGFLPVLFSFLSKLLT